MLMYFFYIPLQGLQLEGNDSLGHFISINIKMQPMAIIFVDNTLHVFKT